MMSLNSAAISAEFNPAQLPEQPVQAPTQPVEQLLAHDVHCPLHESSQPTLHD